MVKIDYKSAGVDIDAGNDKTHPYLALTGRVPCKVIGEVHKGQRLISSDTPGVARAVTDYEKEVGMDWFRVVGRAIENKDTLGVGLVEVVVGVK